MPVDKILVTGAGGQLGTALVPALAAIYGAENVLATDIRNVGRFACRFELLDVTNADAVRSMAERYQITQIYHLAAILSAKGEQNPLTTWDINLRSFLNVLEISKISGIKKVFFPSSIAVFGETANLESVGQYEPLLPATAYGISKAASENWAHYYHVRYGLDVRSVRYPGIVGYQSAPGGGTTDYAVEIFHAAVTGKDYNCFLKEGTVLPMIYMEDAITAALQLMEAPSERIKVRSSYNLAGLSFSPKAIVSEIRRYFPEFQVNYVPDFRQEIAALWPRGIDDSLARSDWNWSPSYNLRMLTEEMVHRLAEKYGSSLLY